MSVFVFPCKLRMKMLQVLRSLQTERSRAVIYTTYSHGTSHKHITFDCFYMIVSFQQIFPGFYTSQLKGTISLQK